MAQKKLASGKQVHNIPHGYCNKCQQMKDMERFYWLKKVASGMAWRCRTCQTPNTTGQITKRIPE